MNACDLVQPLLAEWIANELDAADSTRVREHLAGCAACRSEEREMREVLAVLDAESSEDGLGGIADPGEPYWAGFASRVREGIPAQPVRAKATPARSNVVRLFDRAPRFAVAALAAAALVVFALRMPGPTTANPDAQLAALLASPAAEGLDDVFAPPSSFAIAGLGTDDLDRLGAGLASAAPAPLPVDDFDDLEDLDDLSPELLEKVLERLDAT